MGMAGDVSPQGDEMKMQVTGLPEEVAAKALGFLNACKEKHVVGIVILLDGSAELTVLGNGGLNNGNAAETLRQIANLASGPEVVVETEFDVTTDVQEMN